MVPTLSEPSNLWSLRFKDLVVAMNVNLRAQLDADIVWKVPADIAGKPAHEILTDERYLEIPPQIILPPLSVVVFQLSRPNNQLLYT